MNFKAEYTQFNSVDNKAMKRKEITPLFLPISDSPIFPNIIGASLMITNWISKGNLTCHIHAKLKLSFNPCTSDQLAA